MIALAIDRLDQRRHTFGLLLEHLVAALRDEASDLDLALIRDRRRTEIRVTGVRELFIPRALVPNAFYTRFGLGWMQRSGARLVHFPFLHAPARVSGIKTVVTIHGASRASLGDDLVLRFRASELERLRSRLQHVDRVITVSESARDEVVEHYRIPPERITVIYNGVGAGFHPDAANESVLARYGIRRPFILTISTLKPKKNVAASVRTFAQLRRRHPDLPHQLVLVGYKASGYTEVDDTIRELGLAEHVVQTGWTESSDIPTFYAAADLVLFPTLHEGFGLPIIEAMASGCPVAASRVFSVPEVGGTAILTFDPAVEEEMAAATERTLFDREFRDDLVVRGIERARLFTWGDAARKTAAVYRELLEKG